MCKMLTVFCLFACYTSGLNFKIKDLPSVLMTRCVVLTNTPDVFCLFIGELYSLFLTF